MHPYQSESLSHDALHGYIRFTSRVGLPPGEVAERDIIDSPWVQRLRQIHQLQTAWWVFPTAEHTRFQHVVGVMHLASRAVAALYDSLKQICPDTPSRPCVESLLRLAGLLHDVGHGPFGHFFDDHFLSRFELTHESLGGRIIREELGDMLRSVRRNPGGCLEPHETIDPDDIAWLITRPRNDQPQDKPRWLHFLRSLMSGIYTIDNMDFVLRDAYMSGYSQRAFDLDRLLHYSFFSEHGLTIHDRGMDALLRFMGARAELFRAVYFHRTVRAIDLTLAELFRDGGDLIFDGNPAEQLDRYQRFTEWSLLVDASRLSESHDPRRRELGDRWRRLLAREIPWKMVCQRSLVFAQGDAERGSIFSDAEIVEKKLREQLPGEFADQPLRVDLPRHIYRPHTRGPAAGQNFLFDSAQNRVRPLEDHQLFRHLPVSHRICRVYAKSPEVGPAASRGLDALLGSSADDLTNM